MDFETNDQIANDAEGISIMEYVYIVWHWAWLILLIGAVAGGLAYFISSQQTPVYETTTSLLVNDPPAQANVASAAIASGVNSAITYSEMIANNPVLDRMIEKLNALCNPTASDTPTPVVSGYCPINRTKQMLRNALNVTVLPNTQIINIGVTDTNPALAVKIAETIGEAFREYIQEIQSIRFANSETSLKKQIAELQIARDNFEVGSTQYIQLNTQLTTANGSLTAVILSEAQSATNVIVIETPNVPTNPISPRVPLTTILAAFVGLLLGTGGILVAEYLDDTIKNPEEIHTKYGLTVLGLIASHIAPDGKPITVDQPRNPISEAFRALRTNIQFASVDHPVYTFLVTSATPQDGKTTVSTNLAIALAQGGKKVVIIDADMRRPKLHERLGLQNRTGLSNLFVKPLDFIATAIQSSGVTDLSVITSGAIPPNPSELLSSNKMAQILEKLHETYDVVVIDTPPILSVTDAVALSTMVDGVLLVAKPGTTKSAAFKQAVQALRRVNANILGAVMNDIEPRSSRYGQYYRQFYSKYVYYYDETTGEKTTRKKINKEQAEQKR